MVKKLKKFKSIPLLALTLANISMAIRYGLNWLSILAIALAALSLILDLIEVFKRD